MTISHALIIRVEVLHIWMTYCAKQSSLCRWLDLQATLKDIKGMKYHLKMQIIIKTIREACYLFAMF